MDAIQRLLVDPRPPRLRSPWGDVQHSERIGEGVTFVSTASHGGLRLDADAQKRLPREVRDCFMNGHGWAEEDCEAPIVLTLLDLMDSDRGRLTALCMAMKLPRYAAAIPYLEAKTGFDAVGRAGGKPGGKLDPTRVEPAGALCDWCDEPATRQTKENGHTTRACADHWDEWVVGQAQDAQDRRLGL